MIGDSELAGAVGYEGVDLLESPGVDEEFDALAGGELSPVVLLFDAVEPAGRQVLLLAGVEGIKAFLGWIFRRPWSAFRA